MNTLSTIQGPADLKKLTIAQLQQLAQDIRADLIARVTATGGHIGPNLGVVELTLALHYVFESPTDKIVFDVSHQSYVHKMLTGRYADFMAGRTSGYTNPAESAHDPFMVGHTSTAVSLAVGLAMGRNRLGGHENVVAVVGDGALSGGQAFEGLDNAAELHGNLIIVVNDNEISIAPNHGGIYRGLAHLRATGGKGQPNLFAALGLDYRYVEQGNDVAALVEALRAVKDIDHPIVVHIHTHKGLGLPWADANREGCHWIPPQDAAPADNDGWRTATAQWLADAVRADPTLTVINAATPGAAGITPAMRAAMGDCYIDVGICEPHAVSVAAGIAARGGKAVYLVFSSFVQRTYDQLMQEIALNAAPCVVLVYGGGMAYSDPTHAGLYDMAMIATIPGLLCLAPASRQGYFDTLRWAIQQRQTPVVIHIPFSLPSCPYDAGEVTRAHIWRKGDAVALVGLGDAVFWAMEAAEVLSAHGVEATVVNHIVYSAPDTQCLDGLLGHRLFVTLENGTVDGGLGQKIAAYLGGYGRKVLVRGVPKRFVDRCTVQAQRAQFGLDTPSLVRDILAALQN